MKKISLLAICSLLLLTACNTGYGLLQDHSEFVSAKLAGDQRRVVFSAHHYAYRPASGWRAFPDGGVPDYVPECKKATRWGWPFCILQFYVDEPFRTATLAPA